MTLVIQSHYKDLSKILSLSQDTLYSLSGGCYQAGLINLQTKTSITASSCKVGAVMLLDHLQMKIEQSPDYLTVVLRLMAEETSLEEVVQRMESFTKELQTRKLLKKDEKG